MKRYRLQHGGPGIYYNGLAEHPDGRWVLHADAEAEIARLRGLLDRLAHFVDSEQVATAHGLLGDINWLVENYRKPGGSTAGGLLAGLKRRAEALTEGTSDD